jgi:hypothetical protein
MTTFSRHASELSYSISLLHSGLRCIAVAAVLIVRCQDANAVDHGTQRQDCPVDNKDSAILHFSGPSDTAVVRAYGETAAQMLKDKKYKELDCFAERVRFKKEQLPEGRWKLDVIYSGLASPVIYPVHATEEDWNLRLRELHKWTLASPKSITARVALAET